MALTSCGNVLYIAFNDTTNGIVVKSFDTSDPQAVWETVGSDTAMPKGSKISICVGASDDIFVSFRDKSEDNGCVYHFDGTDWAGGVVVPQIGNGYLPIVFVSGTPYMAYYNKTQYQNQLAKYEEGGSWTRVGILAGPPMDIYADGAKIYVLSLDWRSSYRGLVTCFDTANGNNNTDVGPYFSEDQADWPSVVVEGGIPYVSYTEGGKTYVKCFNGSAWEAAAGGTAVHHTNAYYGSLGVSEGEIYVSYGAGSAAPSYALTVVKPDPLPISDFTITGKNDTSASFSFKAPTAATAVELKQSTDGGINWVDAVTRQSLTATSTSATVIGLDPDTTYDFKLVVTGGLYAGESNVVTLTTDAISPDLTVSKTHMGSFSQGQTGATYTITVSNIGQAPTSGTITVTDTLPAGLTATAFSGEGWTTDLSGLPTVTATRSDSLASGQSFPVLTLTVDVASDAPASITNTAIVSGGGEINLANSTASDTTTVVDTSPPVIISLSPPDDSTDVAVDSKLVLTFNEPVWGVADKWMSVNTVDDGWLTKWTVGSFYTGNGTATATFSGNLESGQQHYITIDPGAFVNADGVPFAGIADSTTWNFSTTGTDAIPPKSFWVNGLTTGDNGVNGDAKSSVTVTWEDSTSADVDHYEIVAKEDSAPAATDVVTGCTDIGPGTGTATFDWTAGADLYVSVVAVDDAGNKTQCSYFLPNLTVALDTPAGDTTPPTEFSVNSPTSGDNGIDGDGESSVTITWTDSISEDVDHYEIVAKEDSAPDATDVVTGYTDIEPGTETVTFDWTAGADLFVGVVAVDSSENKTLCANDIAPNVTVVADTEAVDTTSPSVETYSPPDDAVDVAIDTDLILNFDEEVVEGSGYIYLMQTEDDATVQSFDVTSDVTIDGSTVTIDPDDDLDYDTSYYVTIDAGAFEDLAGNPYDGINDSETWNFTTVEEGGTPADTIPPTAPKNLEVTKRTESSITIEWDPSSDDSGIDEYIVEMAKGNGDFSEAGRTGDTNFRQRGLKSRTEYTFRVRAIDDSPAGNLSEWSDEVSARTKSSSGGGGGGAKTTPSKPPKEDKDEEPEESEEPEDVEETPAVSDLEITLTIGSGLATVNGQQVILDAAPFIQSDTARTMVPIRFVSEQLGATVSWDGVNRHVTIVDGDTTIVLAIGSHLVLVNDEVLTIDSPPVIVGGRTYVPLRFVSEQLGATVQWDEGNKTISITR